MKVPEDLDQKSTLAPRNPPSSSSSSSGLADYGRLTCSMSWRNTCSVPESKGIRDSTAMMEVLRSKRAFDLMCLTMKAESETESESDSVFSDRDMLEDSSTRRVSLSVENLKTFQKRMAQLEYLVRQQEDKLMHLEATMEQQVALRTRKATESLSNKTKTPVAIETKTPVAIETMTKHIQIQDKQLNEAKKLLKNALDERDEAAYAAREAFALTMDLDSKLETVQVEMEQLKSLSRASCPGFRRSIAAAEATRERSRKTIT